MIPSNISREHILKAIEDVVLRDIPIDRHSVKWSVLYNNTQYPPKYIISMANFFANGEEWHPSKFSGGEETNSFLQKLGFRIIRSGSKQQEFPIESHSWKVLSKTVAIKVMDKERAKQRLNGSIEDNKDKNPFLKGIPAIVDALKSGQIECRVYIRRWLFKFQSSR